MSKASHSSRLSRDFVGDRLYQDLKNHAASTPPQQSITSERKLAQQYKVSLTTVRKMITQLVEEGFLYRVHGKGTFVAKRGTSTGLFQKTILNVSYDWSDQFPFFARRLKGILDGADMNGYRIQMHACRQDPNQDMEANYLKEVERNDVAGIILPSLEPQLYAELKRRNSNIKMITFRPLLTSNKDVGNVQINQFSLGYQGGKYLAGLDVKTVMVVYKNPDVIPGIRAGLQESPRRVDLQTIQRPGDDFQKVCNEIIKCKPQGLMILDDRVALSIYQILAQKNLKLLRAINWVSTANVGDDILPPEFARLFLDGYDMGTVAISMLKGMIEGDPGQGPAIIQVDSKFVEPQVHVHA